MISRIRKSLDEKDQGFTLIELLVVIIIIGILAAIAIPVFLNQRKKAVDSSMKSDLRTVAEQLETYYTDNQATGYPNVAAATGSLTIGTDSVKLSPGNQLSVTKNTSGEAYCVLAVNGKGTQNWTYVSSLGGLQDKTKTACPAAADF